MYPINFYRYPPSPLERKFAVSIVSRSFDDRFFIFFWKDATGGWVRKRWKRRRWTRGGEDGGGGDGIVKIVTHTRETEHTCERHDTPPSTTGFDDQYRHRGQTKRDVNSR